MSKQQITEKLQQVARHLGEGWRVDTLVHEHRLPELFNPLQGYRITVFQGWGIEQDKIRLSAGRAKINQSWGRPARQLAADIKRRLWDAMIDEKQKSDEYNKREQQRKEQLDLLQQAAKRIYPRLDERPGRHGYERKLSGSNVAIIISEDNIELTVSKSPEFVLKLMAMIAQEEAKNSRLYRVIITSERLSDPFVWEGMAYSPEDAKGQAKNKGHRKNYLYYHGKASVEEITK